MRIFPWMVSLVLALGMQPAVADTPDISAGVAATTLVSDDAVGPKERVTVAGIGHMSYQRLFQLISEPNESLDDFLLRVGPKLRAFSDATGMEACGEIAQGDGRYGIIGGTSYSHLGCAIFSIKVPQGMTALGVGIHSHGGKSQFKQNREDRIFSGVEDDPRAIGHAVVYGQDLGAFSQQDQAIGRGYLATPDGVLLHAVGGQVTKLARTPK